ncbi:MAG: ATP-binding protein [bacterium]
MHIDNIDNTDSKGVDFDEFMPPGKLNASICLLLVEDSPQHQQLIKNALLNGPLNILITVADSGERGLELLAKEHYDVILLNYSLPKMNGLEFLWSMKKRGITIPTIMITGHGNEQVAVQAMKMGIYDYVNKDGEYLTKLYLIIQRALERHELKIQQDELRQRTAYINKRLQQEKRKLENIISAIGAGLAIIGRDYRVIWSNRTMEEWFKTDGGLEGMPCFVIFKRGSKNCSKCMMRSTFENGGIQRVKHSLVNSDGERKHYQLTTTPLVDINGDVIQVLCLVQDITHQVGMQLKLIQAGKLAAIGELASGLAHQLNNPLVGILNYVQLILRRIAPDDPNRELLDTVERGAKQCRDIVRNLLNFSRPHHFNFELLDLQTIITSTLVLIENTLKVGNIKIIRDINKALPPIEGNVTQIQQVFLNLLMNALHAMPQGGEIRISTDIFRDDTVGLDYAIVKFADSGRGIPKTIIERIFDPFFTTKDKDHGTGLGLSIAYGIIKAHNGKIEVESEEGKGATFLVYFPIAHPKENY